MAYNFSAKILVKLSYGMDHPLFHCLNSRNRVSIVVIGYHSNINLWHFFVLMPMLNSTLKLNLLQSSIYDLKTNYHLLWPVLVKHYFKGGSSLLNMVQLGSGCGQAILGVTNT